MSMQSYTSKTVILIICLLVASLLAAGPVSLLAATRYLPDVTAAMSKASYWSDKQAVPNETLVTYDEIRKVNQAVLNEKACNMNDLAAWSKDTYNVSERSEQLRKSAADDAEYCYKTYKEGGLNARYDADGKEFASQQDAWDRLYSRLINNCVDPGTAETKRTLYAICTRRTEIRTFPEATPLLDDADKADPDFDVQYLSAVSVGEPLIARGVSSDTRYYHVQTGYLSGWIPAEDIAICEDKNEWLAAWQYAPEETLVVYDDRIYTEESNFSPQVSKRMLTMGTRLKLADRKDWEGRINNRSAYNNYVVWMPVRQNDGSYAAQLSLISEHCKVHEGFLPLTASNLAMVMLNQLGDAYGWGGMLSTQDCSGYVRDVYRCFGLEMARNTSWQAAEPVKKYNLAGKSDQEKAEIIKSLPLGTELLFSGHAMLYLGNDNNKLYVISSVSNLAVDGQKYRVRGAVINTLDITRANGSSWLSNLHTAVIPYYNAKAESISGAVVKDISDQVYNGQGLTPKPEVSLNGKTLKENVHYTLAYSDNTAVGNAAVSITGMGNYEGTISKTFKIKEGTANVSMSLAKNVYTYSGKVIQPAVTVMVGNRRLAASEYTVTYQAGRKNVGVYKVSVQLKNGYAGSASATFRIIPKGTSITKLSRGKRSFVVRWKKQTTKMASKLITGYQIQYATNKSFTNGRETVTIKGYKKYSRKLKDLRTKKKYFVRVRTYMTLNKKNYYSAWSKTRTVVTK